MRERSAIAGILVLVLLLCWLCRRFLREEAVWLIGCSGLLLWQIGSGIFPVGRLGPRHLLNEQYRPFISVVIPAHNEERVVAGCVEAVLGLQYHDPEGAPLFEVIAVDDGSTDGTLNVLQNMWHRYPHLRICSRRTGSSAGKGAALLAVGPLCRGEVLAYFDADARVGPRFLESTVPLLADPRVGAVQSQKRVKLQTAGLLARLQADESAMIAGLQRFRDLVCGAVDLMGNGMLIKRNALEDAGGWNSSALTEDLDMGTRLHLHNWHVRFAEEAVVWEEPVGTWTALYQQRLRWAEGSYRRFCRYFWGLLWFNVPSCKTADMFCYMSAFIVPLWLAADSLGQCLFPGGAPFDVNLLAFFGLSSAVLTPMQVAKILYDDGVRNPLVLTGRSLSTSLFLLMWMPTVLMALVRIVRTERPSAWVKTDHAGAAEPAGASGSSWPAFG